MFGSVGRLFTRSVGLQVIAEKMKIYSYLQVVKNLYSYNYTRRADKFKCSYSRISSICPPTRTGEVPD
jgi:hypothetical protein